MKKYKPTKIQRRQSKELVAYANENEIILSLLYDLDLMPEQLTEWSEDWFKMLTVIHHSKSAIDNATKKLPDLP